MPYYRTIYGTHYHMEYGCHGATIACDTNGLSPCSDCCGVGKSITLGGSSPSQGSEDAFVAGGTPNPKIMGDASPFEEPISFEPRSAPSAEPSALPVVPTIITQGHYDGRIPPRPERNPGWLKELVTTQPYAFLQTNKHLGQNIDSLFLGGSNAYGLELDGSDVDVRGFAMRDASDILLGRDFETVTDLETDTTIYSFDKFLNLLGNCNPNIIEFLGLAPDAYERMGDAGRAIHGNKAAFLSKRAAKTFGGYAMSQLNRLENALGRNARTEQAKARMERRSLEKTLSHFADTYASYKKGTASISLTPNSGDKVLIDISMRGVDMSEVKEMLDQTHAVAKSYDRLTARNRKKDPYHLAKHMCHLIRLYRMGREILRGDGVITDRGDAGDRDFLMEIKLGKYLRRNGTEIDSEFFEIVEEDGRKFDEAARQSNLPDEQNTEVINRIKERENLRVIGKKFF